MELPSTVCELCGYAGRLRSLYADRGIVRCPACGLVFYDGSVVPTEVYTKDYFVGGEYLDYLADKATIQRNFRQRIRDVRRLVPHGRLFEIGSAYGFFLELASQHWEVRGVEIVAQAAAYARTTLGLDVEVGDFLNLPDEVGRYDAICMWDVIEHLVHPRLVLAKASRWLKPGGYLVITTGDINSRMSRFRGSRWRLIDPPTHMYYFSPDTLDRALTGVGLAVCHRSHVGYFRSSKSMLYGILMLGWKEWPKLYRVLTLGGLLDFPVYVNLYDIMMVTAQKPVTLRPDAPC